MLLFLGYAGRVSEHVFKDFLFIEYPEDEEDKLWLYLPDSYEYLEQHWEKLCPPNNNMTIFDNSIDHGGWTQIRRKVIQDTLSHNKNFFESGRTVFGGKTGFWRLKPEIHSIVEAIKNCGNDKMMLLAAISLLSSVLDNAKSVPPRKKTRE